ncbi:hypothetical protein PG1791B_1290 [Bifidobacterium pseudolongum subsp. globosum]|nr:hypothetical protein PG1791B_1290 [Bifidobacterium pseudolongum subsp. globosum]
MLGMVFMRSIFVLMCAVSEKKQGVGKTCLLWT